MPFINKKGATETVAPFLLLNAAGFSFSGESEAFIVAMKLFKSH